jgi:ribA/ribD-fused uncharacterized protein
MRALYNGDTDAEMTIRMSKSAVIAKRVGERVVFDLPVKWEHFAYHMLWIANKAKYEQNSHLMEKLLAVKGRFVECNPNDRVWGIGFNKRAPEADDRSKWGGRNLFGDLLTHLREHFIIIQSNYNSHLTRNKRAIDQGDGSGQSPPGKTPKSTS